METTETQSRHFLEKLFIQNRLVNPVKLNAFTHSKTLFKKVCSQLGWTKALANVVLDAYKEFIELKLIGRDWNGCEVTPSWCIRQVWKLHALSDKKEYEEACTCLCGRMIHYQIEVKQDPDSDIDTVAEREKFTKHVYLFRFNHTMNGSVWQFRFNPEWKKEYQQLPDRSKSSKRSKKKTKNSKSKQPHVSGGSGDNSNSNGNETTLATTDLSFTSDNNTENSDHAGENANIPNFESKITDNEQNEAIEGNLMSPPNSTSSISGSSSNQDEARTFPHIPSISDENVPCSSITSTQHLPANSNVASNSNSVTSSSHSDIETLNPTQKKRRTRKTYVFKEPVITRSRAKKMRLSL